MRLCVVSGVCWRGMKGLLGGLGKEAVCVLGGVWGDYGALCEGLGGAGRKRPGCPKVRDKKGSCSSATSWLHDFV